MADWEALPTEICCSMHFQFLQSLSILVHDSTGLALEFAQHCLVPNLLWIVALLRRNWYVVSLIEFQISLGQILVAFSHFAWLYYASRNLSSHCKLQDLGWMHWWWRDRFHNWDWHWLCRRHGSSSMCCHKFSVELLLQCLFFQLVLYDLFKLRMVIS